MAIQGWGAGGSSSCSSKKLEPQNKKDQSEAEGLEAPWRVTGVSPGSEAEEAGV